jgi:4-hydroxy-2-oxoheptanedioate aldolase
VWRQSDLGLWWLGEYRLDPQAPGVLAFAEPDIRRYLAAGALFTAVGADAGILARGAEALCAKYKG